MQEGNLSQRRSFFYLHHRMFSPIVGHATADVSDIEIYILLKIQVMDTHIIFLVPHLGKTAQAAIGLGGFLVTVNDGEKCGFSIILVPLTIKQGIFGLDLTTLMKRVFRWHNGEPSLQKLGHRPAE